MKSLWRKLWPVLRVLLPVALVAAVGWHFAALLRRPELWERPLELKAVPLVLSGVLYLACHTLWATFWWLLLRNQRVPASWAVALKGYFVSQLGKYVPGKAWVIVMRVAILRHVAPSRAVVALTGVYETLTSMAAGAMVAAALAPFLADRGDGLFAGRGWVLAAVACVPLGFVALHALARRVGRKYAPEVAVARLPLWLMAAGVWIAAVGWLLLGLSVMLALDALLPAGSGPGGFGAWLRLTAANAAAYVLGFVVLVAPGGVGAREWAMQRLLGGELSAMGIAAAGGVAVVVALVLRLVWTAAEMLAIAALSRLVRVPEPTA